MGDFMFRHYTELRSYFTKQLTINYGCMRVYCI